MAVRAAGANDGVGWSSVPIATDADQRSVADALRGWAAKANTVATARSAETAPDGWRKHWAELAELGVFAVAVPESAGGAGGRVVDLAVMLEAAATALVPGPVATTALAALLVSRSSGASPDLLGRLVSGDLPCGVALDVAAMCVTPSDDGSLTVTGSAPLVLGADARTALLIGARSGDAERWFLVDADAPGVEITDRPAADFSRTLASVELTETVIASEHVLVGVSTAAVRHLAVTLLAAEASGVASWCLRTAVDYARVREQFGRPIGAFQAIKHLCAEMLCRVEVATALAWDAAMAADDREQLGIAAAAAGSLVFDAALETAKDCVQVLGGIGFTWEHDAHLYLRRAIALRQLLGTGAPWRRELTERTVAGERRHLHIQLGDAEDGTREQLRAEIEAVAALDAVQQRAALADSGLLAPHWPSPSGRDATAAQQLMIDEELQRAGVSRPDLVIGGWAAPTILAHGTPEQADRFVGPTLRGEITWCQLFSEPGAGSDLAALRTRAERAEGGWRLTGQKVWTSVARQAHLGICLARTDPSAAKHRGITYFLVDMSSPGIDIRPLREITGEALFNEVFLDDVFVPDDMVVGEVNDGWRLARTTLVNERIAMGGGSSLGDAVERLVDLAAGGSTADPLDERTGNRLGELIAAGLACSLLDVRAALRKLEGTDGGAEASVRKLVGVRHRQAVAEAGLDLVGPSGALDGEQLYAFLQTRCLTIAGGTTQVLLSLAAERLLGLPRD
jgi:hypothetical protein